MSDYPMLISNKLHSFRNFGMQRYDFPEKIRGIGPESHRLSSEKTPIASV